MSDIKQEIKLPQNSQEMKPGQFLLSPLESILINKRMPLGLKLETEENVLKSMEMAKQVIKKAKITSDKQKYKRTDNSDLLSNENSYISNQQKALRNRKQIRDDIGYNNDKDMIPKNKGNSSKVAINKKCEKGFAKLRKNPLSEQFYNSYNPDIPSLGMIEKNIRNYKYESLLDFIGELRSVWAYYFGTFTQNPDIYQKTLEMSELSEVIYKELQAMPDGNEIKELGKRIDNMAKDIKELKGSQPLPTPQYEKKPENRMSMIEKPMSLNEKHTLGNNIRNLPMEQLKGILKILSETMNIPEKSSHFEFDIDKLSPKKLRELEKYVNNCMKNPNRRKEGDEAQRVTQKKTETQINQQRQPQQNLQQKPSYPQQNIGQNIQMTSAIPANGHNMMGNTHGVDNNAYQEIKKGLSADNLNNKKVVNNSKPVLSDIDSLSSSESDSGSMSSLNK